MNFYLNFFFIVKSWLLKLGIKNNLSPSWKKLLRYKKILIKQSHKKNYKNKKILIATNTGGLRFATHLESLISIALYLKGYEVEFLLCDGSLKACLMAQHDTISTNSILKNDMKKICNSCFSEGKIPFSDIGFKINYFSDFYSVFDKKKISNELENLSFREMKNFKLDNICLGEHAYSNLLRYFAVGMLHETQLNNDLLRKFLYSAYISKIVTENLLKSTNFNKVFLHHAIYVPQGTVAQVSSNYSIDYISWNQTYKNKTIELAKNNHVALSNIFEDNSKWVDKDVSYENEMQLVEYFKKKKTNISSDWQNYLPIENNEELVHFVKNNNLKDKRNKTACLYTNLIWDAQVIFPNLVFEDMMEWIFSTIIYFQKRKDLKLIIRIHPAESRAKFKSVSKVRDAINKKFNKLSHNILIIEPESNINSYLLADYASLNLVYSSRISYELSYLGHNVVVAGAAYAKNKGVTLDPITKEDYFSLLDSFPNDLPPMSKSRKLNALKYANYYLNDKCIEISSIKNLSGNWPPYYFDKNLIEDLLLEKDTGINKIVKFITE